MPERPECTVPTCPRPQGSRKHVGSAGLCDSHYARLRKYGDPLAGPPIIDRTPGKREYIVGEIEWFLSFGISPERITVELAYKPDSLVTALKRWGRADLAKLFQNPVEENWAKRTVRGGYKRHDAA